MNKILIEVSAKEIWLADEINLVRNVLSVCYKSMSLEESYQLSVRLTDDIEITDLNKIYRKKNQPTNVLSFPQDEERMIFDEIPSKILGDIVLSLEKIKIESVELNKPFKNHLTHILIHGLLHLLGYNHQNDKEAKIMERFETNILSKLSIPAPYN